MADFTCTNCAGVNFSAVRTYKHDWFSCNDCGTVHRRRRPAYAFDIWPIRVLINSTPLRKIFGITILRQEDVVEEERKFYDLYAKAAADGVKDTKWEPLTGMRFEDFRKHGIEIAGRSVLEISGGPGFLSKEIQKVASRVVVTEFSAPAAAGMARALHIDAIKYDYNSDDISACAEGPFDVVLIIYSIGFCNDLRAFVRSLAKVMHDRSVVYVTHNPGTLGLMLRWQFDEYTYNRCWELETMAKCFAEIGFHEKAREDEGAIAYDHVWYDEAGTWIGALLKRLHRRIATYYRTVALQSNASINRELVHKSFKQIFAKP